MSIWSREISVEEINQSISDCIEEHLDIKIVEIGEDFIRATMPVDHRTRQPYGLLHGGASVVLAETLGSMGSTFCVQSDEQKVVGIEVNANHLRQVRRGSVTGTARPLQLGGKIHVWDIKIHDDQQSLVSICRLTVAILAASR